MIMLKIVIQFVKQETVLNTQLIQMKTDIKAVSMSVH